MASEVSTNELSALVTCELFTFKNIFFTLKPHNIANKEIAYKVHNKQCLNFYEFLAYSSLYFFFMRKK